MSKISTIQPKHVALMFHGIASNLREGPYFESKLRSYHLQMIFLFSTTITAIAKVIATTSTAAASTTSAATSATTVEGGFQRNLTIN